VQAPIPLAEPHSIEQRYVSGQWIVAFWQAPVPVQSTSQSKPGGQLRVAPEQLPVPVQEIVHAPWAQPPVQAAGQVPPGGCGAAAQVPLLELLLDEEVVLEEVVLDELVEPEELLAPEELLVPVALVVPDEEVVPVDVAPDDDAPPAPLPPVLPPPVPKCSPLLPHAAARSTAPSADPVANVPRIPKRYHDRGPGRSPAWGRSGSVSSRRPSGTRLRRSGGGPCGR
jgi:hypothetical protein